MYKISIIIPVYQVEKYICRCIDSVLSQTYSNLEIILIDDGSKDMSGKLCDEYAIKDSRVKVIHQENSGVSVARNKGIDVCTGDYVTFVDSDDYLETFMYEKMIKKAEFYNCDVVMCDCVKDDGIEQIPYSHDIREGFYDYDQLKEEYYPHLLMMENIEYPPTISNWVLLFKREMVTNIRYVEGVRFSEDLLFGAQLLYNAKSFYYMKGKLYYHYWMNNESTSHSFKIDKWIDYNKLIGEASRVFKEEIFQTQWYYMILFFLYNTYGEIISTQELNYKQKKTYLKKISKSKYVKEMFKNLSIPKLNISFKQKIITYMYKYNFGIKLLIWKKKNENKNIIY